VINDRAELEALRVQERLDAKALEESWREVLGTTSGRRVVLAIIARLRGDSVWRPGAEIHRSAALRDAGDALERDVLELAPDLGALLLSEASEARIRKIQQRQLADSVKRDAKR